MPMASFLLPAPVRGLDTRSNLIYADPEYALELTNWIPGINLVSSRRGYKVLTSSQFFETPFKSLIPFISPGGGGNCLFAGSDTGLFKVQVPGGGAIKLINGGNGERWSGGSLSIGKVTKMRLTDGGDKNIVYDSSSPGRVETVNVLPEDAISWVTVHHGRYILGRRNSLNFYYLPTGTVEPLRRTDYVEFRLGQFMKKGGTLIGAASWSKDTGSGMHDYAVFTSSEGESCVYQGSNPGDSSAWGLVGVFEHGRPLGTENRCYQKIGADLYISTTDGVQSFSSIINETSEQLGFAEMTNRIANRIAEAVRMASGFGWGLELHPSEQLLYFNVPYGTKSEQFVFNVLTKAVTHFTGIDVFCLAALGDKLYATGRTAVQMGGSAQGYPIYLLDSGRTDNGQPIHLLLRHSFSALGDPTRPKQITHAQIHIESDSDPDVKIDLLTDLENKHQIHQQAPPTPTGDVSVWNEAVWGGKKTPPVEDPGRWAGTRRVYNKYIGLRKYAKFAALSIKAACRDTGMTLHGSTLFFLPSSKTTPRNLQ